MRLKKVSSLLFAIGFTLVSATTVFADKTGQAVYRDGVPFNEWHAGISVNSAGDSIGEAVGLGHETSIDPFEDFLYNQTFKGYYTADPKNLEDLSYNEYMAKMRAIASTAKKLANKQIKYNLTMPIDTYMPSGTYITVDDIGSLRCDGFVEYCYEWNGIEVMSFTGEDGERYWDVTNYKNGFWHHVATLGKPTWLSSTKMTPKKQATASNSRMYFVSDTQP